MRLYFSMGHTFDLDCFEGLNDPNGTNILASQIYFKDSYREIVKKHTTNTHFILDSGAFTVWKTGGQVDFKKYIKRANELNDYFEGKLIAVNLDIIPGMFGQHPSKENVEDSCQRGFENYLYFKSQFSGKIMPVFHQHDNIKWLHKYLEYEPYLLGISPANDLSTQKRIPFLDQCFKHTQDRQRCHGLAVVSQTLLERYPWYSTDAATFTAMAGMGQFYTFKKNKMIVSGYRDKKGILKTGSFISTLFDTDGLYKHQNRRMHNFVEFKKLEKYINSLWAHRGIIWED